MKATAFIMTALIFLIFIISGPVYFESLSSEADLNAFAYSQEHQDTNIPMKPLSREDSMDRKNQSIELKLMTFNMHRGIGKDGKLDLNAAVDVINASNAAIVGLQEVERYSIRTGFKDQIKYLSDQLGMNYSFGKSINVLNGEYGNGLLSKYPIEEYAAYDLPSYNEQRTLLRTVLNINGYRLAVYNTHLGLKQAERMEQLEFILQLLGKETIDYVLMGDMNSKAAKLDSVIAVMKDSAIGSVGEHQSTFEENGVNERIDYIFVMQNMEVNNYDVIISEASDHYPVISEILVNK